MSSSWFVSFCNPVGGMRALSNASGESWRSAGRDALEALLVLEKKVIDNGLITGLF